MRFLFFSIKPFFAKALKRQHHHRARSWGASLWIVLLFSSNVFAETVTTASSSPDVLVFASFSMSDDSLKAWLLDAKKINAAVIVRGLVNNSFKETMARLAPLLKQVPSGLLLDPTLFVGYDIEQVPAVVVRNSDKCQAPTRCLDTNAFAIFYGNTSLAYGLKQIAKSDHPLAPEAARALIMLERGEH